MRLRVKHKDGQQVINDVDENAQIEEFLAILMSVFDEPVIAIKSGFPPKSVDLNSDKSLKELGIRDGDNLIIEIAKGDESANNQRVIPTSEIPSIYIPELKKHLILRNIPDDNSCLFNAISYAVNGYDAYKSWSKPTDLRKVVTSYITNDPKYSEIVLGRPVDQYCTWIMKKDSWGGAIELGILADWFNVAIYCLDIETNNFIKFNEEKEKLIVLVYSGVHYEVLVLNEKLSTNESDKVNDVTYYLDVEPVIRYSTELCTLLQLQNYSTNTTTFRIRCLQCYKVFVGEMGANNHANETNHFNFGEVK